LVEELFVIDSEINLHLSIARHLTAKEDRQIKKQADGSAKTLWRISFPNDDDDETTLKEEVEEVMKASIIAQVTLLTNSPSLSLSLTHSWVAIIDFPFHMHETRLACLSHDATAFIRFVSNHRSSIKELTTAAASDVFVTYFS